MNRNVAEITRDALELSPNDQFKLARTLLESAQFQVDPGIAKAWDEEIARRIEAIDAGRAKGRSFSEVLNDLDARLRAV